MIADLHGYADEISVEPGGRLAIMAHSTGGAPWSARLVGFEARADGEIDAVDLGVEAASAVPGAEQRISAGSCVVIDVEPDAYDPAAGVRVELRIWCRRLLRREATLMGRWHDAGRAGFAVALRPDMRLVWRLGNRDGVSELVLDEPLEVGAWHAVRAEWAPDGGRVSVRSTVLVSGGNLHGYVHLGVGERSVHAEGQGAPAPPAACPLVVGAHVAELGSEGRRRFGGHFTGKVEAPAIAIGGAPAGAWDLGADIGAAGAPGHRVPDLTGHGRDAVLRNCPARCVTGSAWTGCETDYRVAPAHYAAVHLHEHDIEDAEWEPGLTWDVPADLPSGVYGMQLRSEHASDCIPFVVRPPRTGPRARIALVLPTATYMAYANDHMAVDAPGAELALAHTPVLEDVHRFLAEHREYGLALYDQHADGSAVMYSSRLRPMLSMRHSFSSSSSGRTWGLKADLQLVDWLRRSGYAFDTLTDEDVDRDGAELLEPYAAVLTGAHPEYVSARISGAFERHVSTGGRMLYLGGNGFWWVTAFHPDKPHLIEVRRGEAGAHWDVAPGESRNSFTGEPGGLWSTRGRSAQRLVGVGYTASGFDRSSPYRRWAASSGTIGQRLFAGVEGEVFGDFGTAGGGAAGLELDRADLHAGTPPQALVLASSEGHSSAYLGLGQDALAPTNDTSGRFNPRVRADLVWFDVPGGGGVFATGSIAWVSSLGHDGGDNDVARITSNALNMALSRDFFR